MAKGYAEAGIDLSGITIPQILNVLNIEIDNGKILCPFHDDKNPSMQVNLDFLFCHACNKSWTKYWFIKEYTKTNVKRWVELHAEQLKSAESVVKPGATYQGPVAKEFIEYWHSQLTPEHRQHLKDWRLLTDETIDKYQLGYRPDVNAYSIPFFTSEGVAETMQFRSLDPEAAKKYFGLTEHYKPSIMNQYLLTQEQEYIIILFGSFDGILAAQDGLPAVGINGISVYLRRYAEELKQRFSLQKRGYIIPDATVSEFAPAYAMAEILGYEVAFFPEGDWGKDYTDWRVSGNTAEEFINQVIHGSFAKVDKELVQDILFFISQGKADFAYAHTIIRGYGQVAACVARELANQDPVVPLNKKWKDFQKDMRQVQTETGLVAMIDAWSQQANYLQGGW